MAPGFSDEAFYCCDAYCSFNIQCIAKQYARQISFKSLWIFLCIQNQYPPCLRFLRFKLRLKVVFPHAPVTTNVCLRHNRFYFMLAWFIHRSLRPEVDSILGWTDPIDDHCIYCTSNTYFILLQNNILFQEFIKM